MRLVRSIAELKEFLPGKTGFVPTMGNLHEGHLSLVRESGRRDAHTVVSIFVNPAQFGPDEDFESYPRTLDEDLEKLQTCNVEIVFAPDSKEMYIDAGVYVDEDRLSRRLCGAWRSGHFRGVLTVVLKFFNLIRPQRAYFGRKDYQQYVLIRKMVRDLNLNIEVVPCPVIREKDGLALSSRNSYLNGEERNNALQLSRALKESKKLFLNGITSAEELKNNAKSIMNTIDIQYIELVDPDSLEPVDIAEKDTVMAVAAFAGATRLIDNTILGQEEL